MTKRRGRKVTTALLNDSLALTRSLEEQTRVLHNWHPGSIPLAIIAQQLDAFISELAQRKPEATEEP